MVVSSCRAPPRMNESLIWENIGTLLNFSSLSFFHPLTWIRIGWIVEIREQRSLSPFAHPSCWVGFWAWMMRLSDFCRCHLHKVMMMGTRVFCLIQIFFKICYTPGVDKHVSHETDFDTQSCPLICCTLAAPMIVSVKNKSWVSKMLLNSSYVFSIRLFLLPCFLMDLRFIECGCMMLPASNKLDTPADCFW